jgi:hypothetical protein
MCCGPPPPSPGHWTNGAEAIQAFADLDRLDHAARAWPAEQRLRAGERGGKPLEGFDLGNSPLAVTEERVGGKRIFMSTTNGTRSLDCVRDVPLLLTACLPNRQRRGGQAGRAGLRAGLDRGQRLGGGLLPGGQPGGRGPGLPW